VNSARIASIVFLVVLIVAFIVVRRSMNRRK
jgi:hypothetical protein